MSSIGRAEEIVLLVLDAGNDRELTSAEIYEVIADKVPSTTLGAIFVTLDRAVKRKLVSRRKAPGLEDGGGKPRSYYKITNSGRAALAEATKFSAAIQSLTLALQSR
jgi:DNA-binding PadR family transcriptional regulator